VEVRVPCDEVESAIARLLDLAPGGFAERIDGTAVVMTVYGPAAVVMAVAEAFPGAAVGEVESGWEDAWRAFHRPVVVGGIWIGPPWEIPAEGLPAVVIDPGRAFGTGAHPTTRLCVELLSRTGRGSLLDVGCGSGVLSIAASRLGFGPLRAIDVDPIAVEVTRENAAANGVTLDARLVDAAAANLPAADVAVVNIFLPTVREVLPRLAAPTAVTSGYLDSESPDVPGWRFVERVEAEGWAADRFERIASPLAGA
jgi:ribosomal protein L11 methyltransferase